MKENANSRRNMQVVGDMYARVMRDLAEKEGKGESYPSLKRFGASVFYAVGVLIISPTVGGCGLGGLRSNVDTEGGKYTSAIASVYLPPSSSTLR